MNGASRIDRPDTLAEAVRRLAEPAARPIGGGVGILLRARLGEPPAKRYVAVGALAELRLVEVDQAADELVVGGAVTLAELALSPLVRDYAPLLGAAAASVASVGIRSIASLAGNLIDAPANSDLVAAAMALDARIEVRSATGARVTALPVDLSPGELVVALRIPIRPVRWSLRRLRTQGAADRPALTVAVAVQLADALVRSLRAAATFCADRPLDLSGALAGLEGSPAGDLASGALATRIDALVLAAVDRELAAGLVLQDDLRASATYRREVLGTLVARATVDAMGTR